MFPSWKIAKIFGINVFIHWTFWLLPAWVLFTRQESVENMNLWMHLLLIGALFSCVVMHELGHALTARRFGIGTRSITLSPLGGVAQLERMSQKPWEEFCIAIAGPLVNVGLVALLGAGLFAGYLFDPQRIDSGPWLFVTILLMLNVIMVIFNMIPAFPMDGGRILRALLAHALGLLQGTRVAVAVGTVVAVLMGVAGAFLLGNPWLMFIALFVIWAGQQELHALEMQEQEGPAEVTAVARLTHPLMHITVCIWDPQRGAWIRRS